MDTRVVRDTPKTEICTARDLRTSDDVYLHSSTPEPYGKSD